MTELLGGEALTWLEKQIEGFDSITLTLDGSIQRAYGDLIAGVVAGSGVALSPRSLTTDACQEGQDSLGEIQPAPEYDPETELAAASGGDEQSEDRGSDTHVSTHEPDNLSPYCSRAPGVGSGSRTCWTPSKQPPSRPSPLDRQSMASMIQSSWRALTARTVTSMIPVRGFVASAASA